MSNTSLLTFVESYEDIALKVATLKARERDLSAEAKSVGYDPATIKRVVRARLKSAEQIAKEQQAKAEREALYEIYCASLGMFDGTPLGAAARERLAREFKEAPAKPQKPKKGGGAAAGQQPDPEDAPAPAAEPEPPKTIGPEEIAGARKAGAAAHRDGVNVLRNPFVAGDPRRAAWDEGWCAEAGSDGMAIPAAYRRTAKKKPEDEPPAPDAPAPDAPGPDQVRGNPGQGRAR